MKKKLLTFGSYVLVAVLASVLTLASTAGIAAGSSKLAQLEDLMLQRFIAEWIPLENAYFARLAVRACCQFAFDAGAE